MNCEGTNDKDLELRKARESIELALNWDAIVSKMTAKNTNFTSYFDFTATTPPRTSLDCESSCDRLPLETINSLLQQQNDLEGFPDNSIRNLGIDTENELERQNKEKAKQILEKDPNLVEWAGVHDPDHPQNMPAWKKWVITMTLSSLTIWVTFSSSVFSEAVFATADEFGVSTEVTTLGTSLPLLVGSLTIISAIRC